MQPQAAKRSIRPRLRQVHSRDGTANGRRHRKCGSVWLSQCPHSRAPHRSLAGVSPKGGLAVGATFCMGQVCVLRLTRLLHSMADTALAIRPTDIEARIGRRRSARSFPCEAQDGAQKVGIAGGIDPRCPNDQVRVAPLLIERLLRPQACSRHRWITNLADRLRARVACSHLQKHNRWRNGSA